MVNPDELESTVIGRGASSYVQRASHVPSDTPLALKVINMYDKSKREQLIKEIRALYRTECPTVITFHGAFFREGCITIALEYMDGGSLRNVVKQVGAIPESTIANIAFQILWGLAYLKHEKRVHRDLKPSNILINSLGEIKLTDFGVSTDLQNSIAMCTTFVGTFNYMSPERMRNLPYQYSSDVWSLGIVLIECATGVYPYNDATTYIDMVQTVLESPSPTLPSGSQFSHEFRDFLAQLLIKDPKQRLPADILLGSPASKMGPRLF